VSYKLNLASFPFRNRGLPWTIAVLLGLVSVAALAFILSQNAQVRRDSEQVKREINTLNQEIAQIKQKDQEIAATLTPEQKRDWRAAYGLINRKRFPWSRLFVDLEGILPRNVRVNRINVRDIAARGGEIVSEFELVVQSKDTDTVTGMVEQMENGGVFQADIMNQALLKGKNEVGTEWTLRVRYRPRSGVSAPSGNTIAVNQGGER
jgi:Tfp pilus assembly protein PilN